MDVDQALAAEIETAVNQVVESEVKVATEPSQPAPVVPTAPLAEEPVESVSTEPEFQESDSDQPVIEPVQSASEQTIPPMRSPIDNALVERAIRVGLSFNEALGFSDESLTAVVGALERKVQADAEVAKTKIETKQEDDALDLFATLNKEDFEPEVVQLLETLAGQVKAQRDEIRALKSTSEQSAAAAQQVAVREVEDWFDKQISGLGEDYANTLGTGGYRTLAPGSAQLAKRDALAGQMAILLAGYQTIGRQAPSREDVFNSALKMVLGDEIAKMSQRKVEEKLRRSAGQHIQRTGGKSEKTPGGGDPEAEVAALINEKFFGKEEAR